MEQNLKELLKEQQQLTQKINEALSNSIALDIGTLKMSKSNIESHSDILEDTIKKIYVVLNDKSKSLNGPQRKILFSYRSDLIALRAELNSVLKKTTEFITEIENPQQRVMMKEYRGKENVVKQGGSVKEQGIAHSLNSNLVREKRNVNNQIESSRSVKRNKAIEAEALIRIKKIEANLGLYFMIAIGTLLCLFGISVFGKYVYVNLLGNMGKGILMYVISLLVLFTGQFLLKKVKNITIVKECVIGLGLGLLYLTAIVNFLVLDNASYIVTHFILIGISLYALYLSRKSNLDIIRIVGMIGIYIALIPINEPTFVSSLYILALGYTFTVLNILVPLKNTKYFEMINIVAIIIFSILVNVYTSILSINIINSLIAIGFSRYIYHKSEVKLPELYLFSFSANIIILETVVEHSDFLILLIAVAVVCYLPILNAIKDVKKQILYKTITLALSTFLLFAALESSILLILALNFMYFSNIYYSNLAKNIYEHRFEFIALIFINIVLILNDSVSVLYLVTGLVPSIYVLSKCNYQEKFNYIIAFILQILSFRVFIETFSFDNLYTKDALVVIYAVAMIAYNFILFKENKIRKINMLVYFIFSIVLFRSYIFIAVLLLAFLGILFKKKISNKIAFYITMLSVFKLSCIVYLSNENNYMLGIFILTTFLGFAYMYKHYNESKEVDILAGLTVIFAIISFVVDLPVLITIFVLGIFGIFYSKIKSLVDLLMICITTIFIVISGYDNSYMIFILLGTLFICTSLLKWNKIQYLNISYYSLISLILVRAIWRESEWFVFAIIAINLLIAHPILKRYEKYFKIGTYAYAFFAIASLVIFGFLYNEILMLCVLTVYYLICLEISKEEEINMISIVVVLAFATLGLHMSSYMMPVLLVIGLNYKKIIMQKDIDAMMIILMIICIVRGVIHENPIIFILSVIAICSSRYVYNLKESFITKNVYKEYKYFKFTDITLIGVLSVIMRMFVYTYSLDTVIGIFIYAIISSFGIIVIGFYIKSAWFRKVGLGSAMATCTSILIFIKGMDTIQKIFVCCGVGITCIVIAAAYSKLEKKYISK
ncbi:MAG: hypothetical protein ACRCTZ_18765 [Sarcina sp.]